MLLIVSASTILPYSSCVLRSSEYDTVRYSMSDTMKMIISIEAKSAVPYKLTQPPQTYMHEIEYGSCCVGAHIVAFLLQAEAEP